MFTCTNERKEPFPTPLFYREGKILIFSMCLLVSVRFIGRTFGTGSNFCETIAAQLKKGHKSFRLPRPFCRTFILVSIGLTHDHEMKRDEDGDLLLRSDLVASQPRDQTLCSKPASHRVYTSTYWEANQLFLSISDPISYLLLTGLYPGCFLV